MIRMRLIHTIYTTVLIGCASWGLDTVRAQEPERPVVQQVSFPLDTLSIVEAGARGDGQYLNTEAINTAIRTISKKGGGVVLVPGGLWLTGPIEMKSNVNLHVQRDAVILFTADFNAYKLVESNWEGEPAWRNQSPISGKNLENIAITGAGVIDGNGGAWRMVKREKMTDAQWKKLLASGGVVDDAGKIWYPSESALLGAKRQQSGRKEGSNNAEDFLAVKDFLRPNLLVFTSCKRILLEGVTIQNSPAWNIHPLMCEDLTVRNLTVRNPWYGQNGDGLDIESSKNVLVENSTFDVGDDAICIKSGRDKAGRERAMPTENVIIRNNIVYHGHGGFVIGSEMSGGARNIWVEDCSFIGTDIGLRFKTTRGRGGVVENIFINTINMVGIPGEAILFDMYYGIKGPLPKAGLSGEDKADIPIVTEETPRFQNFEIRNIQVNGAAKGIFFRGLPEMSIKNILIENANMVVKKGVELIEASNITVKNLTLKTEESDPLIHVHNSKNILFTDLKSAADIDLLMQVSGASTEKVVLTGAKTSGVKKISAFSNGASEKALEIN